MTTEKNDKTNENQNRETNDDNSFWEDTRENVTEGARIVGEEARRIGGQISSYSEKIFGKVSDSATDAYKISTEFTRDAVNGAQALAEKYKDKQEIIDINEEDEKSS
jgi:hypothetical protein